MLSNKQVENSDHRVDKEEAVIRNKWEVSRVLAVARVLLDVVLSVAASVILSLLLISGDVEENPGPGGNLMTCLLNQTSIC